jgi:glutamyl-tRNA synthetase
MYSKYFSKGGNLKNHPNIDHGRRKVWVDHSVYIAKEDALRLNSGDEIRLIELYNIRVVGIETEGNKLTIIGSWSGDNIKQNIPKIQWVANNDTIPFKIIVPRELYKDELYNDNSLEVWKGFRESFVSTLKTDTKVQFVRSGFCRIDGTDTAIYTHR